MSKRIAGFDLVRSLAVLLVVSGHIRHLCLPNFNGDNPVLYLVTSFGHFGVIIFFGLSGILVSKRMHLISSYRHVSNFLVLRLYRVYVVLIPALLLTYLLDSCATSLKLYDNIEAYEILSQLSNPETRLTANNLMFNLVSLQTFYASFYGSNGPLWSLSLEVWFYIFGALVALDRRWILLSLPLIWVYPMWIAYFVFWYMAPILVNVFSHKNRLVFFVTTILFLWIHVQKYPLIDFGYMMYFIVNFKYVVRLSGNRLSSFLAKISYSLYAYHYPILLFTVFFIFSDSVKNLSIDEVIGLLIILSSIIGVLYYLVEGSSWSSKIYKKLQNRAAIDI